MRSALAFAERARIQGKYINKSQGARCAGWVRLPDLWMTVRTQEDSLSLALSFYMMIFFIIEICVIIITMILNLFSLLGCSKNVELAPLTLPIPLSLCCKRRRGWPRLTTASGGETGKYGALHPFLPFACLPPPRLQRATQARVVSCKPSQSSQATETPSRFPLLAALQGGGLIAVES